MKTFIWRGARQYTGAVILVLVSWAMPYSTLGEQAQLALPKEASFQPAEPGAVHAAPCCNPASHERAIRANRLEDSGPWTASDIVSGEDLSKLISSKQGVKPVILQVGVEALYRDAHIPESIFAGPAAEPDGLVLLKTKAKAIARNKEIVIYCGCCPWQNCPNIKPAFTALQQMGFKKVKLLSIPTDFQQDWVNKGFPTVRS